MKKYVGMAKRFPETRDELLTTCNPMSRCLSAPDATSLVSVLFREAFSHPYISLFHLLVNGFSVLIIINFSGLSFIANCRDVASGIDRHPDKTEIYLRLQTG